MSEQILNSTYIDVRDMLIEILSSERSQRDLGRFTCTNPSLHGDAEIIHRLHVTL